MATQNQHPVSSSCFYEVIGGDTCFHVLCLCCFKTERGMHGFLESDTKRLVTFPTRSLANKVRSALNAGSCVR